MRLLRRHVGDGSRPPFRGWSLIEGFASLQAAVDIHQHGFQRVQVEAVANCIARCHREKRARRRSSFANGNGPVHYPTAGSWAGETQSYGREPGRCSTERFPDRCERRTSELHERADRTLCSAKRKTKAGSALYLSSVRLQDRRGAVSRFPAWMAHPFAVFLFLFFALRRCISSRLMSEIFSRFAFTW